jgi:large subunit ribosomal protein L9
MEIILLEKIEKLGQMGDTVTVKPGYARNYLLPQKKALRATKANMELFESQRAQLEALNTERREKANTEAESLKDVRLVMVRQASEGGQLYGSVTARDVADELKADGHAVSRNMVELNTAIKNLGEYEVRVILHPEVSLMVPVFVARSQDEAEAMIAGTFKSDAEAEAEELAAIAAEEAATQAEEEAEGNATEFDFEAETEETEA